MDSINRSKLSTFFEYEGNVLRFRYPQDDIPYVELDKII